MNDNTIEHNGDTITITRQCESCKGTGIYVGICERDGAAVVCHTCKGTGREDLKIEAVPFVERKKRPDVVRVFQANPGIIIGKGDDQFKLENFGGKPYDEWLKDGSFGPGMEDRFFTCPAWYYQSANYKLKPDWEKCNGAGSFSECSHFRGKEKCWEQWDGEFGEVTEG